MTQTSTTSSWWFLLPCVVGALGLFSARQAGDGPVGFYAFTVFTACVYAAGWWFWGSRDAFSGPSVAPQILRGVLLGAALAVVFVAGALVVARIPFLAGPVAQLLDTPDQGGLAPTLAVLVINGIGEELIYRDAVPRQLRGRFTELGVGVVSTLIYCAVTVAMGVPLLVFAAGVLGAVCFYEASRSGRLYSPIAVHLTWSTTMLLVMPLMLA
ncbi:CPBP family intramembrane glutamic endopeptidase [Corynebacterium appendicis]|uniref:CPBP family intramembrane glutamic endopeptidase n=1 Tax=Corynebacterium appendicis TaxID=163202 RepID=UPI00254D7507|nr:type II CAAX endopeptidase family protein [Corynebacterium appendicis]MDK8625859.1 type II CAAX endopeptidase family protein [Corynebacterium appendicis]